MHCWGPHRGTPHRRAQSREFSAAHWVRSVGQDVFVVGHGIHVVAQFAGEPRSVQKANSYQLAKDTPGLFGGWIIHPENFSAPKAVEQARLQAWTLKPAMPASVK